MVGPDGVIHLQLNMVRVMDPIGRSFKLAPQLSPTSAILLQRSPGHPGQTFCWSRNPVALVPALQSMQSPTPVVGTSVP
ncbi:hypothetical protein ACMYSQ_007003 [Aspergillus niger]